MVDRIMALIQQKGLSVSAVEKQLGFGNGAIKRFSTSSPSIDKMIALSNFLNTSIDYLALGKENRPPSDLAEDERELITYYRLLIPEQKYRTLGRLEALSELNNQDAPKQRATRYIELYRLPVSAGCGMYLDSDDKDMLEVSSTELTLEANFALTIRGDSMEPEYFDGDIVLIRTQPEVDIGEIGVFIINNDGYIKKFGGNKLISLNNKYPDIFLGEYDNFCCKGKVIGKL